MFLIKLGVDNFAGVNEDEHIRKKRDLLEI